MSKDPYRDASVTRNMVALLGDMADTMDGIGELFREKTFYQALFQELHSDDNFDSTLNWARGDCATIDAIIIITTLTDIDKDKMTQDNDKNRNNNK